MEQDIDAIRLSQKFNAPVQVVLRREHDVQYGPFRPYQKTTIAAAVDSKGNIAGWKQKIASQSIIAETYEDLAQAGGVDMTKVKADVKQRGGFYVMPFDYFAVDETPFNSPYDVGAVHLEYAQMDLPVPPTHWRSVGISGNIFEMEGFMDEVAHAAKVDPIAFRKNLLKANPRNVAVLDELTKMIGWKYPQREKNGWGISFAEGFTARAAAAIQVAVQGKKIVIKRLVAVVDVGQVVTHDQVLAQLQGGIIDGLATASFQEITFKSGKVVQSNWGDYRTYTLAQQPQMELKILDNDAAPGSISELSTPLIIPALTNAVFAATGTRVRELPLTKAGFSV